MLTLKDAQEGKEYIIRDIVTDDEELNSFLFSLGCTDHPEASSMAAFSIM